MAKKDKETPYLYGGQVFASQDLKPAWLKGRSLLEFCPVGHSGVLVVTNWGYAQKRWIEPRDNEPPKPRSRQTYVKKGTILVPRFYDVSESEVIALQKSLKGSQFNINDLGIRLYGIKYQRLGLMEVEDLEAAIRQQEHILENYYDLPEVDTTDFAVYFRVMCTQRITRRVEKRKSCLEKARDHIEARLREKRSSLPSIAKKILDLASSENTESHKKSIINSLQSGIRLCDEFPMRPVGKNMRSAKRALAAAIRHLQIDDLKGASKLVEKAETKLFYPREQK